jgi:hypothetical protein
MNDKDTQIQAAKSQPPPNLTMKVKEGYLTAHASGTRTRGVVSSLVTEIAQAAIENQCGKILIDVRELEGWLSVFDSYYLVTKDFQRLRGKGIVKAAIVDRPLPKSREWFLEIVSHNRGYNLKIFENPEAALEWLLG